MRILGFDTSSGSFSIAILDNDKITEESFNCEKKLSSLIISSIERILKRKKVSLESIDAFAVGLGPGSFTGLRVGISTVKGLAMACAKPVIGISTLDILAANITRENRQICTIIDAKRNSVYYCFYRNNNEHLRKIGSYGLIDIGELIKKIKEDTVFTGDGLDIFGQLIKDKLGKKAIIAERRNWIPKARNLVVMAKERLKSGKFDNPDKLVPLYLYPKECQIKGYNNAK
ncbi:MAG: tRNA (adenosine(37)-N6)-threonylcarbamoyltransferase complex dimerization subunit type 1 TsaB [Candidatus Omnitrophica bacterium]|nr:tRNA (adenosine(37)-N6)-threonylcarbamoyltransferase complex dimerization subunit type 1 TsaB [Candidatus Omnitrophota bacterium]